MNARVRCLSVSLGITYQNPTNRNGPIIERVPIDSGLALPDCRR